MADQTNHVLDTILQLMCEGIVIVDVHGMITELNEAYARFLGIQREQALHRHVTEVIQNTRLHKVLQSGVAEKGQIQIIHGHEMLVHRIPVLREDVVMGAIGLVIFQGVNEQYQMMDRIHQLTLSSTREKLRLQSIHQLHCGHLMQ